MALAAQRQQSTERARERLKDAIRERLATIRRQKATWPHDYHSFAGEALTIRPKAAAPQAFTRNSVQQEFGQALDNQKAETGMVRKIALKARQLGLSTDISGRFYHITRFNPGVRANITAHRDDATRNLMGMVKRFHQHDPGAPAIKFNNANELVFENDSGFSVTTAGAQATGAGRSFTFQLAHLSELALWQNASEHLTAILDAVPDIEGSEVIMESTAYGASGPFYSYAMQARAGVGRYELFFAPWWKHDEYRTEPPAGWTPSDAVRELRDRYDLDDAQLYWAELDNIEKCAMDGQSPDELSWRFRQEMPSNIDEAFRAGRKGGYIAASIVAAARIRVNPHQAESPLIIGCDFATGGGGGDTEAASAQAEDVHGSEDGDSNVFISHRGRNKGNELYERFKDRNTVSVANKLQGHIVKLNPDRVFMDKGGGGAQVFDILCDRGYGGVLELVDFGTSARPVDDRQYRNKRSEMYGDFREWLAEGGSIPDDDLLEAEITAPWVAREDESGLVLAPKREIRRKMHMSPDGADAAVLCHAAPVLKRARAVRVGGGRAR